MPSRTTTGSETSKTDATDRGLGSPTTTICRQIRFQTSRRFKTLLHNTGVVSEHTHTSHGPVQSRYNFRLMTSDIVALELGHIFADQTSAFKLTISYGLNLRNKTSARIRYYHSYCNYCGRYLDEPSLITNADTFENFL